MKKALSIVSLILMMLINSTALADIVITENNAPKIVMDSVENAETATPYGSTDEIGDINLAIEYVLPDEISDISSQYVNSNDLLNVPINCLLKY